MRKIVLLSLLCLAVPAAPARPADDGAAEGKKWSHLKQELPNLPRLSAFLQNAGEEAARRFAEAAFDSAGFRAQEWKDFDALLGGGKKDAGGALIQGELRKLPPEQWYYIIRLDGHRRNLVGIGGGLMGNATQSIGNAFRGQKDQIQIKCFEQAATLLRNMEPIKTSGRPQGVFQGWSSKPVTSNRLKFNEHTAACFRFNAPGGLVEIMADSWDDTLLPASAWWQRDSAMAVKLGGPDGYCGDRYEDLDGEKCRAMNDRVEKFTEGSKKIYNKAKDMLTGWSSPGGDASAGPVGYQSTKSSGKVAPQGARGSKSATVKHTPPPQMPD